MRRTARLSAPFVAATAVAMLSGCSKPEMRRCVDMQDTVVAEELCTAGGEQRILGQTPRPAGTYRFYYGGEGSHEAGTLATSGSYLPLAGHSYEAGQATKRRGFGGSLPAFVIAGIVGAAALYGAGE